MKRVLDVTVTTFKIITKKHLSFRRRLALLSAYLKLIAVRFLNGRFHYEASPQIKLLGFVIFTTSLEDLFFSFEDVFVEENHYFSPKSAAPLIVDCGGNIGLSVFYFKWLIPDSTIYTFEPHPDNYLILVKNIETNNLKNVFAHEVALSREEGIMYLYGEGYSSTMHGGISEQLKEGSTRHDHNIKNPVKIDLLSRYLKGQSVDFIKIDVEGSELEVLQDLSSHGFLKDATIELSIEYHRFSNNVNKLSEVVSILEQNNFRLAFLNMNGVSDVSGLTASNFLRCVLVARKGKNETSFQ